MARTVQELGRGGQTLAMRELGWSEWSIRKGRCELASGLVCSTVKRLGTPVCFRLWRVFWLWRIWERQHWGAC